MSPPRLEGKVAIVTGGASGFGKGIAEKFVREGGNVVIADLSETNGILVAAELDCLFVRTDVTRRADWQRVLAAALDAYGRLDIVVNNAGTSYANKPTEQVTDDEFDLVFKVNVQSLYLSSSVLLGEYFLKTKRPGCFIQVASTGGLRPRPGLAWYNASKGAVITATKSLAVEYAPNKIRFNAVSPVFGITSMTHLFLGRPDTPEARAAFVSTIPLGRPSMPSDVANTCCFLASNEAEFLTGTNVEVDGGRCV